MSVRLATQVLSRTVAAAMDTLYDLGKWDNDSNAMATSNFINNMDALFDVFNSITVRKVGPLLRRGITATSSHFTFLQSAMQWLKCLQVPRKSNKTQLPSVIGWQLNINSIKMIWEELSTKYSLECLLTRRLNQDKLENFFSQIRFCGGHRDNPDSIQFNAAYKQITVNRVLAPVSNKNCEDDVESFLVKVEHFTSNRQTLHTSSSSKREDDSHKLPVLPSDTGEVLAECTSQSNKGQLDCQDSNVVTYITGYLIRKTNEKYEKCSCCSNLWIASHDETTQRNYIFLNKKQYEHLSPGHGLIFPSTSIIDVVSQLEVAFCKYLPYITGEKIYQRLVNALLSAADLSEVSCQQPNCQEAVKYIVSLFARMRIHHFLKEQNRKIQAPDQKRNRKMLKLSHQ
jgi:hypothetical protein